MLRKRQGIVCKKKLKKTSGLSDNKIPELTPLSKEELALQKQNLVEKLNSQLAVYPENDRNEGFALSQLQDNYVLLLKGVRQYNSTYEDRVAAYKVANQIHDPQTTEDAHEGKFFRKQFMQLVAKESILLKIIIKIQKRIGKITPKKQLSRWLNYWVKKVSNCTS